MHQSIIHRVGEQYRLWHKFGDRYVTPPLRRDELGTRLLLAGGTPDEVEARLARADAHGTSGMDSDGVCSTRAMDAWEWERCASCEHFHHAFAPGEGGPGTCRHCGEPPEYEAHLPPCARGPWAELADAGALAPGDEKDAPERLSAQERARGWTGLYLVLATHRHVPLLLRVLARPPTSEDALYRAEVILPGLETPCQGDGPKAPGLDGASLAVLGAVEAVFRARPGWTFGWLARVDRP